MTSIASRPRSPVGVLGACGAVLAVAGALLGDGDGDSFVAGALVLVAAVAVAVAAGRGAAVRLGVGLVAALAVLPALLALRSTLATGVPERGAPVVLVGAVLTLLAAVVALAARWRPAVLAPLGPPRLAGLVAAVGALAAGTALVAVHVAWRAPVRDDLTAAPASPVSTGQAWRWRTATEVTGLATAGTRVVVAGADGVVALDGATGAPRWSWARVGAELEDVTVTPDRRHVALTHVAGTGTGRARSLTVLDAGSGAERWSGRRATTGGTTTATDGAVVTGSDDAMAASALDSGAELWRRAAPPGCSTDPAGARDVVVVALDCPGRRSVQALDTRTGAVRWESAAPVDPVTERRTRNLTSTVAVSGEVVLHDASTGSVRLLDAGSGRTARELGEQALEQVVPAGAGGFLVRTEGDRLALVTTAGTRPLPGAPGACDPRGSRRVAVDAGRLLVACTGPTRSVLLAVDGRPPLDVGVGAADPDEDRAGSRLPPGALLAPGPGAVVVGATGPGRSVVGVR